MKRIILVLALLLTIPSVPASAGELAGVTMAPTAKVGDQSLMLNGMALRKKLFVKVYVAGLYLPAKQTDGARVLEADTPRKTVLHFLYGVDKGKMCTAWYDGLKANTPNASAEVRKQFDTLCGYMEDIEKGEKFEFAYLPGTGTTVWVKGKDKGTIQGKAFADALFASWIGPDPDPGQDFKADLLGG